MLNSNDKEVNVKSCVKQKYFPQGFSDKFLYRSKAVFAFGMIRRRYKKTLTFVKHA